LSPTPRSPSSERLVRGCPMSATPRSPSTEHVASGYPMATPRSPFPERCVSGCLRSATPRSRSVERGTSGCVAASATRESRSAPLLRSSLLSSWPFRSSHVICECRKCR
jgi:hypothetical protein